MALLFADGGAAAGPGLVRGSGAVLHASTMRDIASTTEYSLANARRGDYLASCLPARMDQ